MVADFSEPSLSTSFDVLPPHCYGAVISDTNPKSFKKAMKSDDAELWMSACKKEIDAMLAKNVWTLVRRPKNVNVIRGLWLFKKKFTTEGKISKYKARFVAMGNTQKEGVDYGETFSPTGKPTSLRLLIAIAAIQGWDIHQMDAISAFLNGNLKEDLYLEHPEGFEVSGKEGWVCKLKKLIYGLKQSPKIWGDDV